MTPSSGSFSSADSVTTPYLATTEEIRTLNQTTQTPVSDTVTSTTGPTTLHPVTTQTVFTGSQETNATTKSYTTSNVQQTTPDIAKLSTEAETRPPTTTTVIPTTTPTTTTAIPTTTTVIPTITTTKPTTTVGTTEPQITRVFQVELRILNEQWVPEYAVTGSLEYENLTSEYKAIVSN